MKYMRAFVASLFVMFVIAEARRLPPKNRPEMYALDELISRFEELLAALKQETKQKQHHFEYEMNEEVDPSDHHYFPEWDRPIKRPSPHPPQPWDYPVRLPGKLIPLK